MWPTASSWPASAAPGSSRDSVVPPRHFRRLRKVSRMRRQVVRERARMRILDAAGVRVSGILSNLFGAHGIRIMRGLVDNQPREVILASLTHHVRHNDDKLLDVLNAATERQPRYQDPRRCPVRHHHAVRGDELSRRQADPAS